MSLGFPLLFGLITTQADPPSGAKTEPKPEINLPLIDSLLNSVKTSNLQFTVQKLVDFGTRFCTSKGASDTASFLFNELKSLGYQVKYQYFLGPEGKILTNVIAIKPGCQNTGGDYVLTAHYDSYSTEDPGHYAPGADDNGSGVAALLEVARILSRQPLQGTIELVFFSAEETGQLGSDYYVWDALQNNKKIAAFINVDMVGFSPNIHGLVLHHNPESELLGKKMQGLIDQYFPGLKVRSVKRKMGGDSDHTSFWENGFLGFNLTEDPPGSNQNKHSPNDKPEKLDYHQLEMAAKVALLLILSQAGPIKNASCNPAPAPTTPVAMPTQEKLKQQLKVRLIQEDNLFKMIRFNFIVSGLSDPEITTLFNDKKDKLITAALQGQDFNTKLFALLFIARGQEKQYLSQLLSRFASESDEIKPYYLMALSSIGDQSINHFLLGVYDQEKSPEVRIEALRSYAIINKQEAIEPLQKLKSGETNPLIITAIEEMISAITQGQTIIQPW